MGAVRVPKSSCKLLPPCRQGNHGPKDITKGAHPSKAIGKYYFTEEALKHDLAALKTGEVYERDDFYRRAKAWYKAEIDRLLHLERVKKENSTANSTEHAPETNSEQDQTSPQPPTPPTRSSSPKTATRIQPSRAAKRKAAEPPPKRPPPRKKKAPASTPEPTQPQLLHVSAPTNRDPDPAANWRQYETRGGYALAAYDWAQFRNGNAGEHRPSPWAYVQLQGLDVTYFCMRLERAVEGRVGEVLGRDYHYTGHQDVFQGLAGSGDNQKKDDEDKEGGAVVGERKTRGRKNKGEGDGADKEGQHQLKVVVYPHVKVRCALGDRYDKPPPFEPAAALAPGEDWRPPTIKPGPNAPSIDHANSTRNDAPGVPPHTISWAADEVFRRQEMNRRTGQAPEADMEISPTLGRWGPGKTGKDKGLPVEDLGANVVEVSGLRFAVDLCACRFVGGLGAVEGVRILML